MTQSTEKITKDDVIGILTGKRCSSQELPVHTNTISDVLYTKFSQLEIVFLSKFTFKLRT